MKEILNLHLVSIIVPVYNVEKYVKVCIESLINQTYENLEIILVDDGSIDTSPLICEEYKRKDERIIVIHKENGGAALARETGLKRAQGKYVMFVDSDDWLELDAIEKCVKIAEQKRAECIIFPYIKEYQSTSIEVHFWENSFLCDEIESEEKVHRRVIGVYGKELDHPEKIDNLVSFCMKLYNTEVAKKGIFIDEKVVGTSEDTVFNIYALDRCKTIFYLNECLYHYRRTDSSSITMNYKKNLVDKWDVLYAYFDKYFEETGTKEKYKEVFLNRVACGMIGLGLNEICANSSILKKSKNIKTILNKPLYRNAFSELNIKYCPMKWKVFFVLCKLRMSFLLTVLLTIMNYLRSRISG